MRSLFIRTRYLVAFGGCGLICLGALAQTFAAAVRGPSRAMVVASSGSQFSAPGHAHKSSERLIYGRLRNGMFTVDGMVAKVRLNYDVKGSTYMYLFVPGVGTAIISMAPDGTALFSPATLHTNELTFDMDGHNFNLSGVSLAGKEGQPPAHMYVRMDHMAWHLSRTAMVGFGNRAERPYEWPGALPTQSAEEESLAVPPVPASLLPKTTRPAPARRSPAMEAPAALRPAALR